jgi:hypothetical protein
MNDMKSIADRIIGSLETEQEISRACTEECTRATAYAKCTRYEFSDGSAINIDGVGGCELGITVHTLDDDSTELYHRYPGQHDRQPCYLELDCDRGILSCDWNGEIGNSMPFTVYHRRTLRWTIPALKGYGANALMREVLPICEAIMAGYEIHWDGNNNIGRYTEDAQLAIEELTAYCDGDTWTGEIHVWDASDWFSGTSEDDLGITVTTTDDELEDIAEKLLEEAHSHNVDEIDGLEEYLKDRREELRDAACNE